MKIDTWIFSSVLIFCCNSKSIKSIRYWFLKSCYPLMEIDNWYRAVINHLENLAITHTKIIQKWVSKEQILFVSWYDRDIIVFFHLACPHFVIRELSGKSKPFQWLIWLKKGHPKFWYFKILLSLIWIILGKMVSDCTLIWSAEISMNNENIVQTMITTNPTSVWQLRAYEFVFCPQ